MKSISAAKHTISFTPQESSYFYEAVPCFSRKTIGYGAIAFVIKAPQDASITLEMQTAQQEHDCSGETYSSTWRYVANFTGQVQRVIAPFSSFVGAKAEDIFAFNWATWQTQDTGFVWEMGDIELICGEEDEAGV
ncbi:uncharacterized protein F4812DRAFT_430170 [Daldinia caldariorum]|uniref:uncharacterized protein n=1 Tax=Daldinia caldariorum TaxID=326644 RepID=UPI00200885BB|nr:uncharacterized protein F4812DRAFT_430170 [Daldinia caldariorum]KAI1467614.1 hypothetical protein F4812DRAFT_430170 [Daldinia caldariorum]